MTSKTAVTMCRRSALTGYEVHGSKLTFGPLGGTRMACAGAAGEVAREVTAALERVRAYEVAAETLRLKDAGGRALLTYAAGAPGVQGSWTVISVLYDDAIRSVTADVAALTAVRVSSGRRSGPRRGGASAGAGLRCPLRRRAA